MPLTGLIRPDGTIAARAEFVSEPTSVWGWSPGTRRLLMRLEQREQTGWRSATELIADPLRVRLTRECDYALAPGQLYHRFYGQMFHANLSTIDCEEVTAELELSTRVGDKLILGHLDAYAEFTLFDYKTATQAALNKLRRMGSAARQDWCCQLNLYACLWRRCMSGLLPLTGLMIETFCQTAPQPYLWPVSIWDSDEAEAFLERRVRAHETAAAIERGQLPPCSDRDDFGGRCKRYCDVRTVCPYRKG